VSEDKRKRLFEQFPPVSTRAWIEKINADLKGADFNKKMIWRTEEGFDVKPFYRQEDIERLNHVNTFIQLLAKEDETSINVDVKPKRVDNTWLVRQDISVTDFKAANARALDLLMKGVDSLGFVIMDPESLNEKNIEILIDGIIPEGTEINFISAGKAREIIASLVKIYERSGHGLSSVRGAVEADPVGRLMMNGTLCIPPEAGFDYLASLTRDTLQLPSFRNIRVTGADLRNAGSGIVQELGFSISMAVEYLSQLTDRGIDPDKAASRMRFSFGIGSDYFMEIAKLRAARILWSMVSDGYGFSGSGDFRMQIHSVTSMWNSTVYDPYVNMLRTQTAAMSAVLGGTDSLTVNPFDIAYKEPGDFSERIARNQQLILKEEAYFDRVTDPASGSYYIENLTSLVAEKAWSLFLEIENEGGFLSALKSGIVQDKIEHSAGQKKENISRRKEILLGTNQYPDPGEMSHHHNKAMYDTQLNAEGELIVRPLYISRAAGDLEKIRMAVERSQSRPAVFLLPAGDKVMRRARAQFSSAFFGCAGYRIIENEGYEDLDKGIEDALGSKAEIIVLCSSDEEYSVLAPVLMKRAGDCAIIVVAGNPPDIELLKETGLKNFISVRSDLGESLRYYNSCLGIKTI
jgi:methylmalonyl-CoA mutase